MVSQVFGDFLASFNIWLWVLFFIIIFLTLALNKGTKRFYFLIMVVGFLSIFFFIDNFYVANILVFCWLLLLNLKLFASTWVLIFFIGLSVLLGLANPFFYIIILALWAVVIWHFVQATFGMLDPKKAAE
ncbi:hypothetical protein KKG83_06945 [Candidatus Micrarchaeota archaeon]|nr:hypothetical protein [Candidatus Micrarchaeota archaeon]MBU2477181.1 hypothetical protein [Candidatus Micrarchaeota archaeon]